MKKYTKILYIFIGLFIAIGIPVFAANLQPSFTPSLIPVTTDKYYLGSTSPNSEWNGIYTKNLNVSGTCTGCGSGSGGSGTVGTSTVETAGYFANWFTTAGTPAKLNGTSAIFQLGSNIGIGTLNPVDVNANARLTVAGISSQDIIASTTDNTTLSDAILQAYAPGSRIFMGAHGTNQVSSRYGLTLGGWGEISAFNSTFGTTNGLVIGTNTAMPLVFGTNNAEVARFTSGGRLGIGTTNPGANIHDSFDATSTASTVTGLHIGTTATSQPDGNGTYFSINTLAKSFLGNLFDLQASSTSRFTGTASGNLGINATTSLATLEVKARTPLTLTGTVTYINNTTLTGNGTVFTKELSVGSQITANAVTRAITAVNSDTSATVELAWGGTATAVTATTKPPVFRFTEPGGNVIGQAIWDRGGLEVSFSDVGGRTFGLNNAVNQSGFFVTTSGVFGSSQSGSQLFGTLPSIGAVPTATSREAIIARGINSQTADIFQVQNSTPTTLFNVTSAGNVGIGTTTPYANISVQSGASTGDAFVVATSSGNAVFGIDNSGHRFSSGPAPAISSCGTGTGTVIGDDQGGTITTATAATSCTMTFAKAYSGNGLYCNVTDDSLVGFADISATSTTAVTFGISSALSGGHLFYQCAYHK